MQNVKVANACLCTDCVSILYKFHSLKRKSLRTEDDLRLHIRKQPTVKTVYLNEVFTYKKPKNTITDANKFAVNLFPCKICDRSFRTKGKLNYHIRDYHGRERFQCDQCSRQFVSKSIYDEHLKDHKKPDSRQFVCRICNILYHTANSLNSHTNKKHKTDDQKPFSCTVCTKRFSYKHVLVTHMRVHNKEQYKFKCTLCNYVANTISLLNDHLSKTHQQKLYCKTCDRSFKSDESLKEHMRRCHNQYQNYQCTECNRTFNIKSLYDKHLAYHKRPDAERYMCKKCNFIFQCRTSVGRHQRLMHAESTNKE